MAPRSAFAAAAAAAVLGLANGLSSLPAAGVPCSSLDPSNPQYPTCTNSWTPTDYYTQMKQGVLSLAGLGADTNGESIKDPNPRADVWPVQLMSICAFTGALFLRGD